MSDRSSQAVKGYITSAEPFVEQRHVAKPAITANSRRMTAVRGGQGGLGSAASALLLVDTGALTELDEPEGE